MSANFGRCFIISIFFILLSFRIFSLTNGVDSLFDCFQDVFDINDLEDLEDAEEENDESNNKKFRFHRKLAKLIKKHISKLKKLFQSTPHKLIKLCQGKLFFLFCLKFCLCISLPTCIVLRYLYYLQDSNTVILSYIHKQDGEK